MIIELRGVEFINKGAELMLHAMMDKIRQQFPDVIFVMDAWVRAPREKLMEHGIYTKNRFGYRRDGLKISFNTAYVYNFLPAPKRHEKYYVSENEIDVVLDASGFAFGDQWGAKKAGTRLADHIADWKAQGKKVIMMPQALGPFTNPELVEKMKTITRNADLIFARDPISYDYITALAERTDHIVLKPDFTNLIKGKVPETFDTSLYEVGIIPNSKMIDTNSAEEGEAYHHLLVKLISMIQQEGKKPFFLIHESQSDGKIADKANRALTQKIPVIKEEDPLKVKGIIGASQAVITSRFHGLVSCLSQAVPCLSTGWSHKYEMLLKDYDYPEALLDVKASDEVLEERIHMILNPASSEQISQKLEAKGKEQKALSDSMWQLVFEKIKA